ncbi:MAG: hypothetical protein AB7F76_00320 [Parvibaculaceae bacterium]
MAAAPFAVPEWTLALSPFLVVLGLVLVIVSVIGGLRDFYKRRRLERPAPQVPELKKSQSVKTAMPLIELRDSIKKQAGWDLQGAGLHYLDLGKAFREAAHSGVFEVRGRLEAKSGFRSDAILTSIPREHWLDASLDMFRFPIAERNEDIVTYYVDPSLRPTHNTYYDLQVERQAAMRWAQSDAAKYRGERR